MKNKYDYWSNAKNELCKPTVLDGRLSAARLADSAPDLLAALEAVTLAIEQLVDIRPGSPVAYSVRNARAAIAKAKGE